MEKYFTQYYGSDWMGMLMTFLFLYYVARKKRIAFVFGILANFSWIVYAVISGSVANCLANTVFIFLNVQGYMKWQK